MSDDATARPWRLDAVLPHAGALPHGVTVWRLDLSNAEALREDVRGFLSNPERTQLAADRATPWRARRALVRAALRGLLGQACGLAAQDVPLVRGADGKPGLDAAAGQPDLHFNVSHSATQALIVLSRAGAVGIDIERCKARRDVVALARVAFSPAEAASVAAVTGSARLSRFYRLWCAKEACVKADGRGLSLGLRRFVIASPAAGSSRLVAVDWPDRSAAPWAAPQLWELVVPDDYCATLAMLPTPP